VKLPFSKYHVSLARDKPSKTTGQEQGTSGSQADSYFSIDQALGGLKRPSINQIMNMIDNDGTATMLYNVITFPVLATDWHIEPDAADVLVDKDGNETHPQADFVDHCLRDPLHKGGMSTPFSLVLSDLLLAVAQGFRVFEIVYKIDADGRIVFQKIAARDHGDVKILKDDTGGFNGFEQSSYKNGKSETVTIELPYAFLYTYRKDRHKLYGMSAFRAAYYHFDKKHRLYYLANQQAQQHAVNPKILESPTGSEEKDRNANLANVDKMAVRPSIALPFGWKLTVHQPGQGINLLPYIDHQDVQMARSQLAQMTMLGTQSGAKGGSFSLHESSLDLFMLGECALIMTIEEHITAFLISKLISYNFDKPLYPTFKFNDLTDSVNTLLTEAFKGLVSKGQVPGWVAKGIAKKVAEQMEIEEPDDAESEDIGDGPIQDNKDGAGGKQTQSRKKKDIKLAKSEWWRELTDPESKVQFSTIEKRANTAEEQLLKDVKPVIEKISADATKRLKPLLEEKGANALDGFELKFGDDLKKVMGDQMLDTYSTAKTMAADELKVNAPANKQKSKDLITQHTQAIVDKQFADLLFELKTIVTDAVRKNKLDKTEFSVGDVLSLIATAFLEFYESKEPLTASSLITTAINIGRDDVFQDNEDEIYGYQYSAILDDSVCRICEDLDSSVVPETTYYSTVWMPPIHFNCRCIWVAIMNDEQDKPDFTGLPDAPGGVTAPLLSHGHDDYAVYLSKQAEATWRKRRI
jgi:hypothetical protein